MKPQISISKHASSVHTLVNEELYARLLEVLEAKARAYGYEFVKGTDQRDFTLDERREIGHALVQERAAFISPYRTPDDLESISKRNCLDGDGDRWIDSLLSALAKLEIVLQAMPSRAVLTQV